MGFVDTRLTLFAIITAIEKDLRSVILEHLWPQLSRSKVLFGCELYEKCARRFVDENTAEPVDTAANELIVFSDLGDLFQVLNSHRAVSVARHKIHLGSLFFSGRSQPV